MFKSTVEDNNSSLMKKNAMKKHSEQTFYMIDKDIDRSGSMLAEIMSSKKDAFSNPSLLCKLIDKVPKDEHINIVLNTNGGALSHCEKILKKLLKHPGGYTAYIRGECYSAGAIVALGATEIVMNDDSYIGKIDPQIASEQLTIYAHLDEKYIDSRNIYDVINARYTLNYVHNLLEHIYKNGIPNEIKNYLLYSELPHCALFDYECCKEKIKLNVRQPTKCELHYFNIDVKVKKYEKA